MLNSVYHTYFRLVLLFCSYCSAVFSMFRESDTDSSDVEVPLTVINDDYAIPIGKFELFLVHRKSFGG